MIKKEVPLLNAADKNPRKEAQKMLAAARLAGDRRREMAALLDLGIAYWRAARFQDAARTLSESLPLARELGDRSSESDILVYLGLATRALGDPIRGRELLEQALACARQAGDRYAEKLSLQFLGDFHDAQGEYLPASTAYTQALELARALGFRQHEAKLQWSLAIQYAERGEPHQACAFAESALHVTRELGNPHVGDLVERLHQYRETGLPNFLRLPDAPAAGRLSRSLDPRSTKEIRAKESSTDHDGRQPSMLAAGLSATKSMVKFLATGLKTVSPEVREFRQQICSACEHHTGLRCRICSCFTILKSKLPHEECPIQKWSAEQRDRGPFA